MDFPRRSRRAAVAAIVLAAIVLAAVARPASAEIVLLSTGRTLSIKSHRADADKVTLVLRQGGELTCPASIIVRIDPDEVPYPEDSSPAVEVSAVARPAQPLTGPYSDVIKAAATRHGLDPSLVHALIRAESNYQPRARSPRGARGLMQLMPETLRAYQVRNAYDPTANVEAGTKYLRTLLDRFPLAEALAAYNAGADAVVRYGGIPPFPETRAYVTRILTTLDANGLVVR
jgi:soluble lytic murein transglycosylase-like protein